MNKQIILLCRRTMLLLALLMPLVAWADSSEGDNPMFTGILAAAGTTENPTNATSNGGEAQGYHSYSGDENVLFLFDGGQNTKWTAKVETASAVAIAVFKAEMPVRVNGYTITSAQDATEYGNRNPKTWVLSGWNGTGWDEIHSVTDDNTMAAAKDYDEFHFTFTPVNSNLYTYFKWEITKNYGGTALADNTGEKVVSLYDFDLDVEYCEISTKGQLDAFRDYVNKGHYTTNAKLMADITYNNNVLNADGSLNGTPANRWTSIGGTSEETAYRGDFDGDGHVIRGLFQSGYNAGFIGYFKDGHLTNLVIEDSFFDGINYVGGACSMLISNGDQTDQKREKIQNVGVRATFNARKRDGVTRTAYIGGIVGYQKMTQSYFACINNCYAYGKVINPSYAKYVGGLVGYKSNANRLHGVYSCCSYMEGTTWVCGNVESMEQAQAVPQEAFAIGAVTYALNDNVAASNVFWRQNLTTSPADLFPVTFRQVPEGAKNGYVVYQHQEGESINYNNEQSNAHVHEWDSNGFCIYTAYCHAVQPATLNYQDGYFEISNAGQLYWFSDMVNTQNRNANGRLIADITDNQNVLNNNGNLNETNKSTFRIWCPIADPWGAAESYTSNGFGGTFDGCGHTISGLYVDNSTRQHIALFAKLGNGTIKNVGIKDSYFSGQDYLAGICAVIDGNAHISQCFNEAVIKQINTSSYPYVGGIVALTSDGIKLDISDSYNAGTLMITNTNSSAGRIGGIIARHNQDNYNIVIKNCYNRGTLTSENSECIICDIDASNYNATIQNCYYTGDKATDNTSAEATKVTTEQLASGEVAWKLSAGRGSESPWHQHMTETRDAYPRLFGSADDVVYYGYLSCTQANAEYTNDSHATDTKDPWHNFELVKVNEVWQYRCTKCGEQGDIVFPKWNGTDDIRLHVEGAAGSQYLCTDELTFNLGQSAYNAPREFKAEKLTFKGDLYDAVWQSLYVPFSIDVTKFTGIEFAEIVMVSTKGSLVPGTPEADKNLDVVVLRKLTSGMTKPNTPYCIRNSNGGSHYFVSDMEQVQMSAATADYVNPLTCATTRDNYAFHGVYEQTTLDAPADKWVYVLKNNCMQWVKTSETLSSQSWYMERTSRNGEKPDYSAPAQAKAIFVIGEGEQPTGIISPEADDINTAGGNVYSLSGQFVGTDATVLPAGVYLKKGKKFIIK